MKFAEKDKPVKTIPRGVWESSRPQADRENDNDIANRNTKNKSSVSTDAQGNGYPENK